MSIGSQITMLITLMLTAKASRGVPRPLQLVIPGRRVGDSYDLPLVASR